MKLIRKAGSTSNIFQIFIADSSSTTGAGLTALTSGSSGLTAYYHRDTDTTATVISLTTMTVGTFTSSGFLKIDDTNMPGWYQFCPPDAAMAAGAKSVAFHLKGATNMAPLPIEVDLDAQVDVYLWNGTAVSSPATAGIPDINVKNMNNVAATSITTINANIGVTQPINFTGTAGSALVKGDTVDIAGSAVSTTSAQIGVNAVQINAVSTSSVTTVNANQGTTQPVNFTGTGASALVKGDTVDIAGAAVSATTAQVGVNVVNWNNTVVATPATAGIPDVNAKNWNNLATVALPLVPTVAGRTLDVSAGGEAGLDWANIGSPTTVQGLTGTTISSAQVVASVTGAVGSVTGAVGSVTGNVGGNVTGSVGSVVGNVGGNVTGSVGSVVADVGITQGGADKVFGASGAAMAELAAVPSATPNPRAAIMLPFMELRNQLTTDATTKTVYNTANTPIASKVLSDDGTTYTEAKMT